MTWNLHVDETIYVPSRLVPDGDRFPHSIFKSKVVEIQARSVRCQMPNGQPSELIATSKVHKSVGVALVSIGDFLTEDSLINPLAKGVLQLCRLLLPDDHVTGIRVRAIGELGEWWTKNHGSYTHVVLVGHGSKDGITFGVGGERSARLFLKRLGPANADPKTFISLCCESGRAPFAREFSMLPFCRRYIAPYHSVHGAVAAQFLQSFLNLHLLQGCSPTVAFRKAIASMPSRESFRLWHQGCLVHATNG